MNKKQEGNIYDRVFKENAESIFLPLIQQQLGLDIMSYKPLETKFPKTMEREVDSLLEITSSSGKKSILHIEFQTKDARDMIYRIGIYHGLLLEKHKLPIEHVVIYLGDGMAKMRTEIKDHEKFSGFDLINLSQLDPKILLSSQVPEIVMLALLGKYDKEQSETILRFIVRRLKEHSKSDGGSTKYLNQLILLSRLRHLESQTLQIVKNMLIDYDIQQDYLYGLGEEIGLQKGQEIGLQKGQEIGLQKGEQKGEQKSKIQMASIMLKNNEPLSKIIMYTGLSEAEIRSLI